MKSLTTPFLLLLPVVLSAQTPSLSDQLVADIADHKLDDFSHIEAAFILSGVASEDSLQVYMQWYRDLVERIKQFRFDPIDRMSSANKVFNYIRTTLYDDYQRDSTTLLDIVKDRRYNCVSSTLLYNMVCEDLGWTTQAFETPTHVYTLFTEFDQKVIVENTHSMGFNIMKNLDVYSHYLAQFYPQKQVYKIGLDRLYAHENSHGRTINNTELLGLLAYNQAYLAMKKGDYERAYEMVLVAQDFNRNSPSNVNFELHLYYKWGEERFAAGRFYDAFEVLADGAYRYPENKGLTKNARAAFLNALRKNWRHKDWEQSRKLLDEVTELHIMSSSGWKQVEAVLHNWRTYFQGLSNSVGLHQVASHLQAIKLLDR